VRRIRAIAFVLCLATVAGGCSLIFRSPVKLRGYDLAAAPGANQDSPVRVDLVVVRDEPLAKEVAKLKASEWFAKKGQLILDNPHMLEVTSLEPVPGQALPWRRLRTRGNGQAAFVFADYPSKGDHRVRVDPYRWISIRLAPDSMAVMAGRGP
jgi:type VI secretion system protein